MTKIAVVLSGCGYLDGAEIRESVLTLLSISKAGGEAHIFAPDQDQHHTVNHLVGDEYSGTRNVMIESARIARGKIRPLEELDASEFDALVLPGGFGVAKNLSTFAFKGSEGTVDGDLKQTLLNFKELKKPIGGICIAPAVLAMVFGADNITLTIGEDLATADEVSKTGANHQNCAVNDIVVDDLHKIVTTPAYMYDDAELKDIGEGIDKCIRKVFDLI